MYPSENIFSYDCSLTFLLLKCSVQENHSTVQGQHKSREQHRTSAWGEAAGLQGLLHQRQHLLEAFSDASYNIEPDLHLSSCNFGVCGCSGRDVTKELQAGVRLQGSHMMAGITGVWLTTVSATAEKKKLKCYINLSVLWERTIGIWIRDQSRCLVLCKRSNFPGD